MALRISREFKVGFFIILAIGLFYWGLNYLKGTNVFGASTVYYAVYDNTEGLTSAKAVQINGYQVGLIESIYFHPDKSGRLIVKIKMQEDYPLPANSFAKIHSSGLLGEKNIQLELGNSTELAHDGDTLTSRIEGTLTEAVNAQVAPIKAKAEKLLGSLDTVVMMLTGFLGDDTQENFRKSFASIQKTFVRLDNSSAILESFLKNNQGHFSKLAENLESISDNLNSNNENINTVLGNLASITDSLQKAKIGETFMKVNSAVTELDDMLGKVNRGEGTLGALMNDEELYNNLEDASSSLNRLLLDIKYNPNKYLQFSMFGNNKVYTDQEIQEIEKEIKERKNQDVQEEMDIDKKRN